jgi:hypothetical protein
MLEKSFLSGAWQTKIISFDPEQANARWNLSLMQLTLGNFSQGWENYEARYHKNKQNWKVTPLNITILSGAWQTKIISLTPFWVFNKGKNRIH